MLYMPTVDEIMVGFDRLNHRGIGRSGQLIFVSVDILIPSLKRIGDMQEFGGCALFFFIIRVATNEDQFDLEGIAHDFVTQHFPCRFAMGAGWIHDHQQLRRVCVTKTYARRVLQIMQKMLAGRRKGLHSRQCCA